MPFTDQQILHLLVKTGLLTKHAILLNTAIHLVHTTLTGSVIEVCRGWGGYIGTPAGTFRVALSLTHDPPVTGTAVRHMTPPPLTFCGLQVVNMLWDYQSPSRSSAGLLRVRVEV